MSTYLNNFHLINFNRVFSPEVFSIPMFEPVGKTLNSASEPSLSKAFSRAILFTKLNPLFSTP